MAEFAELWTSASPAARVARTALLPFAAMFRVATGIRDLAYTTGILGAQSLGAPAVSVGNLTVGGTGKTPVTSWIARELAARGARPAIILRGYGNDETLVHRRLTPDMLVLADADRVRAAKAAVTAGATALVLDDAFQHRQVGRDADIVLMSADADDHARWPLPAGPWREPLSALRRARLALVTTKAARMGAVQRTLDAIARCAPGLATGVVSLTPDELIAWDGGERVPASRLRGTRALMVSAIGDPGAFERQLRAAGVDGDTMRFGDHHRFSAADMARIGTRAKPFGRVICTLKDAVKLGPTWTHDAPPLWYLSQRIAVERGTELIAEVLAEVLARRHD